MLGSGAIVPGDTNKQRKNGLMISTSGPIKSRISVLVVEDNPVERQLIGKILRNAHFDVIAIDFGSVVMETVINYQPDLILLDALLPDIDGFEVCIQLRDHPKGKFIPVIMLTGLDDVASINRAYEVGATDFFPKPVNHTLLVHRIRYLLRAREIMDELRLSRQSLASAQKVARLGHWELNLQTRAFRASEEMQQLYQISALYVDECTMEAMIGRCHPEDRSYVNRELTNAIEHHQDVQIEHRIVRDDGSERYVDVHVTVVEGEGDTPYAMGTCVDITGRKESERDVLRLAYFDRLTQLPNRSALELYLDSAIAAAHVGGHNVAVLALDLDLFSRINNSMGHEAGNAVLEELANRLARLFELPLTDDILARLSRSTEELAIEGEAFLARVGADTFVVAMARVSRSDGKVDTLAERMRALFELPFGYKGQELFVTASIGIAYSETGGMQVEALLQHADLALHEAKFQGRNAVCEYSSDLVSKVSSHVAVQSDIRRAIQNNEFQLYYQPKLALKDHTVVGFEALIRWLHPEKGMIPPFEFISITEETGQIVELGEWVLDEACRQHKQWIDRGVADGRMAVNVSARQFKESNFVEMLECVLARTGLSPHNLEIEITEGTIMSNPEASGMISEIRKLGVSIALDDFGTGFSSLSYISRFPIDIVKLDRCFVSGLSVESDNAAIISGVTLISHRLGFQVVAEGVETEEELEMVWDLGCDHLQGYLACRPLPADQMDEWLVKRQQSPLSQINAN